ncbi:MAG: TIGR01841 family phasin [Aquisalimonadaceae bacterium]
MNNETVTQMQKQFESTFSGPARTYAGLVVDHFEQLANLQFETVKAFADTSLKQARAALEVKDPANIRTYFENQQKVAKELGERVKGDAEKVVSLNQGFVQKYQKIAEDSAKNVSKAAGQGK